MPGWEVGIFPNEKSINEGAIEEERRLAYVAITRARRRCVISNTMSRMIFGSRQYNCPSRFVTEMDNKHLDFQGGVRTYAPRPTYQPTPRVQESGARRASRVGKLVSHSEMGSGVVIEDNGEILTVAFKTRGIKKVAQDFLVFD